MSTGAGRTEGTNPIGNVGGGDRRVSGIAPSEGSRGDSEPGASGPCCCHCHPEKLLLLTLIGSVNRVR